MSRNTNPNERAQALPIYSCGSHWHFEPHKHETGEDWLHRIVAKPWYLRMEYPEVGKYQLGQRGIYVRNSSSNGTFRVNYLLASGFYSLKNERGEVQQCIGRHGRLEDKLWREEDLSTQPWGRAAQNTSPYVPAGSSNRHSSYDTAYSTGYEKR